MYSKKIKKRGFVLLYVIIILSFCILLQLLLIKVAIDINTNYKIKTKDIKHYKIN